MNTSVPWEIVLAGPAKKSLERIPLADRSRVESALKVMAADPFHGDVKLIQGKPKRFRRRVGAWRIFFSRIGDERRILISAIERRTTTTY
jgi:mRNA-degrading endonuclease RelE of RelBE toxin-antitoxin system